MANPNAINFADFGIPSQIGTGSSYQLVASGAHTILYQALRDVTGQSSAVIFYDNASGSAMGTHYGPITLAGNESVRDWFAPNGLTVVTGGIFLDVLAGAVSGAIGYQ